MTVRKPIMLHKLNMLLNTVYDLHVRCKNKLKPFSVHRNDHYRHNTLQLLTIIAEDKQKENRWCHCHVSSEQKQKSLKLVALNIVPLLVEYLTSGWPFQGYINVKRWRNAIRFWKQRLQISGEREQRMQDWNEIIYFYKPEKYSILIRCKYYVKK